MMYKAKTTKVKLFELWIYEYDVFTLLGSGTKPMIHNYGIILFGSNARYC